MKAVRRLTVAAGVVGAVALCVVRPTGDTPTAERLDSHTLPAPLADLADLHEAVALGRDLDSRLELALRQNRAKEAVVAEVLAGRLTLLEAAARFRDLNAAWPESRHWHWKASPGVPYELALCRQVIGHVRTEMQRRAPGQADGVAARLEAELAEHLRRHGKVCLPAPE